MLDQPVEQQQAFTTARAEGIGIVFSVQTPYRHIQDAGHFDIRQAYLSGYFVNPAAKHPLPGLPDEVTDGMWCF